MSSPTGETHPEAMTREELTDNVPASKRSNAFTELMSAAKKPKPTSPNPAEDLPEPRRRGWDPRDGLGIYAERPEDNPEGRVVDYDDDFVVIRDKFPKASVHLLLIPRDPKVYFQHPLALLSTSPAFLEKVRTRAARVKALAASELRRLYPSSASDAPYQSALEAHMSSSDPPSPSELASLLPPGRDWEKDIVVGVHTHPSMNHLHIHVISRDMHSPWLKHKKHYLSFNSLFMVRLDEFPLEIGSPRFKPGDWPKWDMQCWRCGRNFANKFAELKRHLEGEFEEWKKE